MMAFALLAGASIAFMGFCVGYGVGYNAPRPVEPGKIETRTTTNTVPLSAVRFDSAHIVFKHDTSRGVLQ